MSKYDISTIEQLKEFNKNELPYVCRELRHFLVKSVSKTGGHLASNLGTVELSVAMLYALDSPKNQIVFDVGHQCYIHKMLTGRKDQFDTLRKYQGLSGFPKRSESEHDAFNTGHSSTSISAAVGIATANSLRNDKHKTYAVIGDGSMTGGMAYEALNNAGKLKSNVCVILNDNEMSIDENTGALAKRLSAMRYNRDYLNTKDNVQKVLSRVPLGGRIEHTIKSTKDTIKGMVSFGAFFEELGFKYYAVFEGHDVVKLVDVLNSINKIDGPVLLHIKTVKGKGYPPAENNPAKFHGVSQFDIKTGEPLKKSKVTNSNVFGDKIFELGSNDKNIIAITAAMESGTGLTKFKKGLYSQFYNVGIAEQHAITFAGGLATKGFIPFVPLYSTFLQRAYDQIIHDLALQNLHVVLPIDRAGLVGDDGETHQGVFDISFLINIPNVTILSPFSKSELEMMLEHAAYNMTGVVAVRYPRGEVVEDVYEVSDVSKPYEIQKGTDTVIVSVGNFTKIGIGVIEQLSDVGLINPRNLSDTKELCDLIKDYKNIIVLEDGMKKNGFGAKLLTDIYENNIKVDTFKIFGYDDFIEQGTQEILYKANGITVDDITEYISSLK